MDGRMIDWSQYTERNKFYCSREWRTLRLIKLERNPMCERCSTPDRPVIAEHVHHTQELQDNPSQRLDISILESLCVSCHSKETFNDHMKGAYEKSIDIQPYRKKWNLEQ